MYTVRLQDFEGPLDLLLFFIKRDELDIYDIPIARLTKEFLEYIHDMQQLDLDVASEFFVMATELMQIKGKMLLPPEPSQQEEVDPRTNLVQRLVEYKRYKESAERMKSRAEAQSLVFFRGFRREDPRVMREEVEEEDVLMDVTLMDLIASFQRAIEKMPKILFHQIVRFSVSLEEQIDFVLNYFNRRSEATFNELTHGMQEKLRIVVTFLACLELTRGGKIVLRQHEPFGELAIIRKVGEQSLG